MERGKMTNRISISAFSIKMTIINQKSFTVPTQSDHLEPRDTMLKSDETSWLNL